MNTGDVLVDRFEVGALAGSGGMGEVFCALDRTTGERVAVKVLRGHDARESTRFVREARVLAELSHPAIVRYVAHGVTAAGELYLAMEWLDGEDLEVRLDRAPLGIDESIAMVHRVADALAIAHARGVVHRDVKPSNLFLVGGRPDAVKVLDFGVARMIAAIHANATAHATNGTSGIVGTVGYMAPEQARGDAGLDARADVFALGCVLYECIAGRAAFEGTQFVAVLMKILLEDPPTLRTVRADVSEALDALVARLLSKDPAARPADAGALARELAGLGVSTSGTPSPARVSLRPASLTRGEQRLLAVILAHRALRDDGRVDDTAATLATEHAAHATVLAAVRASAEEYAARIDRLADGSVLATVAGTGSATDLTLRAARCALALREMLVGTRIALATGRGNDRGSMAAGEVVERVSNLAQSALPGGPVRMDEVTAGLLDARFDVALSDPQTRGLDLRGERDAVDTTRTLLGMPTPFVGREREIAALRGFWDECVAESVARAVLVTAPAGVGKSRLRHEFSKRVLAGDGAPAVWHSHGDPMHAGSSLRFVQQMLRDVLAVSHGQPLDLQRRQIEVRVGRTVATGERQRVAEFLGQILAVHFPDDASVQMRSARQDPMLMADQMRRAWEDFVEAELTDGPVLITMEDVHWCDAASIAYVDSVLRICREKPLMVLALGRPEVNTLFPDMWTERDVQRLPLGGMSRKASEKLVRQVLRERATDETTARAVTQADGNAFFLEELIRAAAEGRGDALPGTVAAMVHARIESLEPDARRVLRAASVFGEVFWDGAVAALLGGERQTGSVRSTLAQLADREIVSRVPSPTFPDQTEYRFRHGVVRQVSYETLMEPDRVLGHKLAAQWLERAGETDAAIVAEHYENAGERASAAPWWLRAAQAAFDANDLGGAIARSERGIACGAQLALRGELRLVQAEASRWRGDNDTAIERADEAAALIAEGTDGWSRAVSEAAVCAGKTGRVDVLLSRSRQLKAAISRSDAPSGALLASARVAASLMSSGNREQGMDLLRDAESRAQDRATQDPALRARLAMATARLALTRGDVGTYYDLTAAAVTQFEHAGDARSACTARGNLGNARMQLGEYAEAAEQLGAAVAEASRMGLRQTSAAMSANRGWALGRLDRLAEAIAMEERAVVESAAQNDRYLEGGSRKYLALLAARAGDLDRAEAEARRAIASTEAFGPMRSHAQAALASVLRDRGRTGEALATARDAMDALARHGAEEGESFTRLVYAELLRASGDRDASHAAISTARDRLLERAAKISSPTVRERFLTRVPEHARTLSLAAEWLGATPSIAQPTGLP